MYKNGFKAGDILAVMLQNIPEYPVIVLGALEAGLVVSTVNPIYTYGKYIARCLFNLQLIVIM